MNSRPLDIDDLSCKYAQFITHGRIYLVHENMNFCPKRSLSCMDQMNIMYYSVVAWMSNTQLIYPTMYYVEPVKPLEKIN